MVAGITLRLQLVVAVGGDEKGLGQQGLHHAVPAVHKAELRHALASG